MESHRSSRSGYDWFRVTHGLTHGRTERARLLLSFNNRYGVDAYNDPCGSASGPGALGACWNLAEYPPPGAADTLVAIVPISSLVPDHQVSAVDPARLGMGVCVPWSMRGSVGRGDLPSNLLGKMSRPNPNSTRVP